MRFDAWNATFPNGVLYHIRDALVSVLGAELEPRPRGLHGYNHSEIIRIDGVTHGVLAFGGLNPRFFVEIKGEPSQLWSEYVRAWSLEYASQCGEILVYLTRADVCYDWEDARDVASIESGLRAHVARQLDAVRGRPPQWSQVGDFHSSEGRARGCTVYMGAASSSIRIRLYDKGAEVRSRGIEASLLLRRAEVQVRPSTKEEKIGWAHLSPEYFWTVSDSVRAVASYLSVPSDGSMVRIPSPPTDLERRKSCAAFQYGEVIKAMARDLLTPDMTVSAFLDAFAGDIERRRAAMLRRAG